MKGVYPATKKDGTAYYRASLTFNRKHISLGSFSTETEANSCYQEGLRLLSSSISISDYKADSPLSFDKWVSLINFRDHNLYFKTPIYIRNKYFYYYLSPTEILKFSSDDLFFYANHTIQRRGNHFFVSDYGMQLNIANRYGIKNFAVKDRDYLFLNGDSLDYRYENIQIINRYLGVQKIMHKGEYRYKSVIHVNGNFTIGIYKTEEQAAIAYNKAIDLLEKKGYPKTYTFNYLDDLSPQVYAEIYTKTKISKKLESI